MKPVGPRGLPYNGGVPRHWNCRSAEIPITYTWRELGVTGLGETRAVVDTGVRASMFGPTEKRTFNSWLKSLPAADQDDILGSKRLGKAFREGRLTVKDLVSAAGRPLLFRELEAAGLIDPRYAKPPKTEWGAYPTVDALRNAILEEVRNPASEYHQFDKQIEEIEVRKAELWDELRQLDRDDPRYKEVEAEIRRLQRLGRDLEHDKQFYLARKYLYPITPGKGRVNFDIEDDVPGPLRDVIQQGAEEFEQMIGRNSVLAEQWVTERDGAYWTGLEMPGPGRRKLRWDEEFFTRDGQKQITFASRAQAALSRGHSHMWGGGAECWIHIAEDNVSHVIHELGHTLESMSQRVIEEVNRYLDWRLGDAFDDIDSPFGSDWKRVHLLRSTHFVHEYAGAFYGYDPRRPCMTEFTSKTLETLMTDPYTLAWQDPLSFEFMLHLLTGRPWKPPA